MNSIFVKDDPIFHQLSNFIWSWFNVLMSMQYLVNTNSNSHTVVSSTSIVLPWCITTNICNSRYGPCDYVYSGLTLEKNLNWAPELLDLLHRLIAMTRHEFNSCFMNLYRHGHDMCGWHADNHPQLGRNPPVASISLGAVRVFEFRKKSGPPNFIRFPLFPGSLLLMEGATQEDWLHCLPRDVTCKEERVNLTFRTMYSIDK